MAVWVWHLGGIYPPGSENSITVLLAHGSSSAARYRTGRRCYLALREGEPLAAARQRDPVRPRAGAGELPRLASIGAGAIAGNTGGAAARGGKAAALAAAATRQYV